jgi:hypothetical protein
LTFSMADMPRGIVMERKARQSVYMDWQTLL